MSAETPPTAPPEETPAAPAKTEAAPAKPQADPAQRGTRVVLVVIALSLSWYLMADRYTPYTQQARVQAYVVPVAAVMSIHAGSNTWPSGSSKVRRYMKPISWRSRMSALPPAVAAASVMASTSSRLSHDRAISTEFVFCASAIGFVAKVLK